MSSAISSVGECRQAIPARLKWLGAMMAGLTKEEIQKWMDQGYNLPKDGVPHKMFGDLWECLDRLDGEGDNVIALEEAACWNVAELARFWDTQRFAVKKTVPRNIASPRDISKSS